MINIFNLLTLLEKRLRWKGLKSNMENKIQTRLILVCKEKDQN